MSIGEVMVLTLIISAFVTFGVTLAWAAHGEHPAQPRAHRPARAAFGSMLHLSNR